MSEQTFRDELLTAAREAEMLKGNLTDRERTVINDQEECKRLLAQTKFRAMEASALRSLEIDRTFCWAHYGCLCEEGKCTDACTPPGGPFTLYNLKHFDPKRLKGVARLLYYELISPKMDLTVEIIDTSNAMYDSFRFKIRW